MMLSVAGITILYLLLNISVTSVIPLERALLPENKYIVSLYIRELFGNTAAVAATVLILVVAISSVFSATLGYTRIPYAAAKDGAFFSVFGKLHPEKNFPHVALLVLGALALVFSVLFRMSEVISGILAMRILIQFVAQTIGLVLLRRRRGSAHLPYRMKAYPLPVIISISIWLFIFYGTGNYAYYGMGFIALGCIAYFLAQHFRLFRSE